MLLTASPRRRRAVRPMNNPTQAMCQHSGRLTVSGGRPIPLRSVGLSTLGRHELHHSGSLNAYRISRLGRAGAFDSIFGKLRLLMRFGCDDDLVQAAGPDLAKVGKGPTLLSRLLTANVALGSRAAIPNPSRNVRFSVAGQCPEVAHRMQNPMIGVLHVIEQFRQRPEPRASAKRRPPERERPLEGSTLQETAFAARSDAVRTRQVDRSPAPVPGRRH